MADGGKEEESVRTSSVDSILHLLKRGEVLLPCLLYTVS